MKTNTILRRYIFKAELKRTNAPGTCIWCGRKLRKKAADINPRGHLGDYLDNAFCGLRCGYAFGVTAAKQGLRLKPYTGPDV